jgi:hypothetical protein
LHYEAAVLLNLLVRWTVGINQAGGITGGSHVHRG